MMDIIKFTVKVLASYNENSHPLNKGSCFSLTWPRVVSINSLTPKPFVETVTKEIGKVVQELNGVVVTMLAIE